jgi:hypothetical protein
LKGLLYQLLGLPLLHSFNGQTSSTTAKAYTFDVLWEQKFGDFVPNAQGAWLLQKDLGFSKANSNISQPEAEGT